METKFALREKCSHRHLEAIEPMFTGIDVDFRAAYPCGVTGMISFRKYRCTDCGVTVTVLEAVVSEE